MSTFQNIRNKVRMLTGRKSTAQLSDSQINFQVNQYYTQEFPLQFRTLDLRKEFSFITEPNTDVYPLDSNDFESFEPTAYVAGYPTIFVQDRTIFHSMFPDIRNDVHLEDGTGIQGPYSGGRINYTPLLKGSVMIYANTTFSTAVKVVDNSQGRLVDLNADGSFGTDRGSIDYQNGNYNVTFPAIVPNGNQIRAQSVQYNANRPTTVFYFKNPQQIVLRPVPDKPYEVRIIAYVPPTALDDSNPSSVPDLNEWWEALAYGAAMKIFENNKDFQSASEMSESLERKLILLGRREWNYLHNEATKTIYNLPAGTSNPGFYFGYYGGIW